MDFKIDLHIHSNCSEDGDLPVEEIFETAQKENISVISITDHDTLDSINIANSILHKFQIEYIPGIELTTILPNDSSQQHILGYYIDHKNKLLKKTLNTIKDYRIEIADKRNKALLDLGFALNEDSVWQMTGNRPPTAASTIVEIFKNEQNKNDKRLHEYFYGSKQDNKILNFYREYFKEGKPAYIPFKSISTQEGIDIIIKSGGIPVLAHPIFVKNINLLNNIKDMGIAGIEALSTYHSDIEINQYIKYALDNNLIITAGSDFHGPTAKPKIKLAGYISNDNIKEYYNSLKEYKIKKNR